MRSGGVAKEACGNEHVMLCGASVVEGGREGEFRAGEGEMAVGDAKERSERARAIARSSKGHPGANCVSPNWYKMKERKIKDDIDISLYNLSPPDKYHKISIRMLSEKFSSWNMQ